MELHTIQARPLFGLDKSQSMPRQRPVQTGQPGPDRVRFRNAGVIGTRSADVQRYLASFPEFGPPPFNAAFHADRRAKLLAQLPPNTTVIVPGGKLMLRNGDVDHPFRQESNFYYLTGFDEPDAVAILSNKPGMPTFTLVVPPRDPARETWTGKRAGVEGAKAIYQADEAWNNTDLAKALEKAVRQGGNIQVLPAVANPELNQKVTQLVEQATSWPRKAKKWLTELQASALVRLKRPQPEQGPHASDIINEMRLIKTSYELALLKRACQVSAAGHLNAIRKLKITDAMVAQQPDNNKGRNEGEVQAEVEYHFRRHGAARVGYGSIAGSGANTCVLHYVSNDRFAKPGDLELVDAGAEYGYYTADITRTWPINGRFTPEQKAIYDLVLKAQEAGIRMTRPGVTLNQIHNECARIITEGLVELGILKGDPKELLKEGAHRKYFMHGTSHMLGMDVHDVPLQNQMQNGVPLRNGPIRERPLQPGMFFTVEPGIYIDPEVARKEGVDPKWWGIGVRIEDDILVTEDGFENFSAEIPRRTEEIEALMRD